MLDRGATQSEGLLHMQDEILTGDQRRALNNYLHRDSDKAGWAFGWRSRGAKDQFSFWHRHFAGYILAGGDATAYDCEPELRQFPVIHALWLELAELMPEKHRLIRCYANGHTYGSDGTVHTDTALPNTYTTIYYPHESWHPDWGGETVFFNRARDEIVASIYPRPNRMLIFDGRIPHVARGVSRLCPVLRVTLMFKTDTGNA